MLHASKLSLGEWVSAAHADDDSPAGMAALLNTSAATAARVSRLLRSTGKPPGRARLAALLTSGRVAARDPLAGYSEAHRRVFAALRSRLRGATAEVVAQDASLSVGHTRRCLRKLESGRFVRRARTHIPWGYGHRLVWLWDLELSEATFNAMERLPWAPPPADHARRVPAAHWWLFWSGSSADELRLPQDGLQIADTMVGGADPWARIWALEHVPVDALKELRTMRGYDTGEVAVDLDLAIERRDRA